MNKIVNNTLCSTSISIEPITAKSIINCYELNFCSEIYNDVSFSKPNARASRERDSVNELNLEPESQ